MRNVLFVFCVMISVSCCIYAAAWLFAGQRQKEAHKAIADRFQFTSHQPARESRSGDADNEDTAGESSGLFDELLALNPDVVGWLKIDGTSINYPVMKSNDNTYYLSHDLYRESNKHGAIFMDYRCEWDGDKIIYGHNMKDGTMLQALTKYKNEAFRRNHDTVFLYNIQGICEIYRVAEVLYWTPSVSPRELSLYEYLEQLKNDYSETSLLYLTTCDAFDADARLIIVAGKESADR